MAVNFYLSPRDAKTTQPDIMAYTHDDVYKPVPGFKVLVSHFHFHFNEQLSDAGMDYQPSWLPTFRALGINIAILADFHSDSHPTDIARLRLDEQKVYFEGSRRFSDRDFLLIPGEEPDANFGGHYMFVFPDSAGFTTPPLQPTNWISSNRKTASFGRRTRAQRAPQAIPTPPGTPTSSTVTVFSAPPSSRSPSTSPKSASAKADASSYSTT